MVHIGAPTAESEPDRLLPAPATRAMAVALADALLAGAWESDAMRHRAELVLGEVAPWLAALVTETLASYRTAPSDRPRELAAFLGELAPLEQGMRAKAGEFPHPRARPVEPTRTTRHRWSTVEVDDLAHLAALLAVDSDRLDWFADRKEINRFTRHRRLLHYRYHWLRNRLIEAPRPRLKAMQRRLLTEVLGPIPVHGAAHGFVPGRDVHTFARPHAGQRTVVRVDLTSFFASIGAPRIYGLLRTAGYPEPVAHTLTALCTTRTPTRVLRRAPHDLDQRPYRLALLSQPHLPQGAPTSPALANLCAFTLDRRLAGLAQAFGATYTRYADDLAFSGDLGLARADALVERVSLIVRDEGFHVHPAKVRVRGQGDRQVLGGLVVNARPQVPREEYDRLRAVLHDAARHGLDHANRAGRADFADYLAGRVAWVGQHHPTRAAKLRRLLWSALQRPPEEAEDERPQEG